MIETKEGLENLESIVTTEGLGGVYIGPADLALAIDLPARGDTDDPKHLATVERLQTTSSARGHSHWRTGVYPAPFRRRIQLCNAELRRRIHGDCAIRRARRRQGGR